MSRTRLKRTGIDSSVFQTTLSSQGFPVINTNTYLGGFKNKIINGNFDIWQRGTDTGFATISGSTINYWPDHHTIAVRTSQYPGASAFGGLYRITQERCGPTELANFSAKFYARLQLQNITSNVITQFNSIISEGGNQTGLVDLLTHRIEGEAANLLGKPVTLSFWARASAPTKIAVLLADIVGRASTNPPLTAFESLTPRIEIVDLNTNWQKIVLTTTMLTYNEVVSSMWSWIPVNPSAPVYNSLSLSQVQPLENWLAFIRILPAVSKSIAISHKWNTSPNFSLANIETLNNSFLTNGTYDIAQVQFEIGNQATSFEQKPVGTELALCQRYYEKSFDLDVPPQVLLTNSPLSAKVLNSAKLFQGIEIFGAAHMTPINWKVTKRTSPTVTLFNATYLDFTDTSNDPITAVNVFRVYEQGPGVIPFVNYPTRTTMFLELSNTSPTDVKTGVSGYYTHLRNTGMATSESGYYAYNVQLWPSLTSPGNVLNPFSLSGISTRPQVPSMMTYAINWTAESEL